MWCHEMTTYQHIFIKWVAFLYCSLPLNSLNIAKHSVSDLTIEWSRLCCLPSTYMYTYIPLITCCLTLYRQRQ